MGAPSDDDEDKERAARRDRARALERQTDRLVASVSREQARRPGAIKSEPQLVQPGAAALIPGAVHRADEPRLSDDATSSAMGMAPREPLAVRRRAMQMLLDEMRRTRSRR